MKKEKQILRVGFQNIGGFPLQKNKHKDDMIRQGIGKLKFDIFRIILVPLIDYHLNMGE
jgi:hypothetical protein